MILFVITFIPIYFFSAWILTIIQVNRSFKQPEIGHDIYLISNNVHVDIVLESRDFDFITDKKYIKIGWGDRGFYMDTPRWRDLKFKTAIKALFYLGTSVMHVTFLDNPGNIKIRITDQQYSELVKLIKNEFIIKDESYVKLNEEFYKALNARTCKYLLGYPDKIKIKAFMSNLGIDFLKKIYYASIGDGYQYMNIYKDNFEMLRNCIQDKLTMNVVYGNKLVKI